MYRNILIPTDGSRISEEAATAGVALARNLGARVTVLHVLPELAEPPLEAWAHGDRAFAPKLESALERRGALFLDAVREIALRAGVACECVLARGASPSGAIVREAHANGCDLIVMGSHGYRGATGLGGSETLKVVALGGIPVLAHHEPIAARIQRRRTA